MPPVTIRRLGPGDEAVLAHLATHDAEYDLEGRGGARQPLEDDAARRYLANPAVLFWAAADGDAVVGFLSCLHVPLRSAAGQELLLYEIGVHHGWRRRGTGGALLDEMDRWMITHGVRDVWVLADNPGAVEFYRACGFGVAAEQPVYMTCTLAADG